MYRILVPLDGSPLAETIMPTAIDMGKALDAEWVLVRVLPPMPVLWNVDSGAWGPVASWEEMESVDRATREEAQDYLAKVRDGMGVPVERVTVDVEEGPLPAAILKAASDRGVTMIAMSTHGRGGLHRLVMGSVTELVVRLSPVPVLVVHPLAVG
jgi:nucleotide-binding universal stress UspA family protein